MSSLKPDLLSDDSIPEAVVSSRSGISIVWLIPLLAAIIGAWVAYQAYSERGPVITVVFNTAEGLEAGSTKVKYKDVEIGQVEAIELEEDLEHVLVTIEMHKDAKRYLTDRTRFWVVRARITAGSVTGLGTLLSGAYIGIDPVEGGKSARHFTGLEMAPIVTADQPGLHFVLKADRRGSLEVGSPIFYRQIKVGEVESYALSEDGQAVEFKVFVYAPHHTLVTENTRFWNTSGLDFSMTAEGIKVGTESVVSLLVGGVAFEEPVNEPGRPAEDNSVFTLYDSHEETLVREVSIKRRYLLFFDGSVRGLTKGAPVEFKGIQMGKVLDVDIVFDPKTEEFRIPVLIETEPERIVPMSTLQSEEEALAQLERMVERGLRAQLKMGSLLTGQLYVDLDFYPRAGKAAIDKSGPYPVMPTVPAPIDEITKSVVSVLEKLEKFPLEELGGDFSTTLDKMNKTLAQAEMALATVENMFAPDAPLSQQLQDTLDELSEAARAMRILADYLDRHPEALIRGKGKK